MGALLDTLAATLAERLAADAAAHGRAPSRLTLSFRQGYGTGLRSRSAPFPPDAATALRALSRPDPQPPHDDTQPSGAPPPLAGALATSAMRLLTASVAAPWELTRLAVGVAFPQVAAAHRGSADSGGLAGFVRRLRGAGGVGHSEGTSVHARAEDECRDEQQKGLESSAGVDEGARDRDRQRASAQKSKAGGSATGVEVRGKNGAAWNVRDSMPQWHTRELAEAQGLAKGRDEDAVRLESVDLAEQRHIMADIARERRRRGAPSAAPTGSAKRARPGAGRGAGGSTTGQRSILDMLRPASRTGG